MTDRLRPWLKHYDADVPPSLMYPSITLVDLFLQQTHDHSNDPCIFFEDQTYTFRQVDQLSNRVRDGLLAIGCRPGESIGILLPNIPAFVISFLGILKMGGVVVALNPTYQPREIAYHLQDSDTSVVFALDSHLPVLTEVRKEIPLKTTITTQTGERLSTVDVSTQVGYDQPVELHGEIKLKELCSISGNGSPQIVIQPESPAILQYSGGTTGVPKAAIGSHRNLVANVHQFSTWLLLQERKVPILAAIPLFHVYGMVLGMWLAIQLGTPMVLVTSPGRGAALFEAIRKYRPGIFPCVPSLYYAILHSPHLDEYRQDLKSLQVCISGSAPLPADLKTTFEQMISGRLVEGFGLSEAPTATHCNPVRGENKTGSIGMPLPDVDCQLVSLDDPSMTVEPGESGELLIRGPQVMKRYYNRDEETRLVLKEGWLHTGDIARMDEEGYFYILGRKKDLIKVGGLQVWPSEIEEVIKSFPGVADVVAAGVSDELMGEVPIAWVVQKADGDIDLSLLKEHCRKYLARYKQPGEIRIIDQIPRSTVGKVLRRLLVDGYRNSE